MSRRDPHFDPIDEFLKNMKSRQFRRMLEQIVKQLPPAQRAEFLVQISDHIRKHVGASTPIKRRSTDHKSTGKKS
jgi:hypothetical protein